MKLKKILFRIVLILMVLCITILSICIYYKHKSYRQYGALLGCPTTDIHFNSEYDETFVYEYMSASYLQKMIEMDASKKVNERIVKLSAIIQSTTFIVINIGSYDLTSMIHFNEYKQTLSYDLDVLNHKVEVVTSTMSTIVSQIQSINHYSKIYLLSQVYPYEVYDENVDKIYTSLNESYQILAEKYKIALISL